MVRITCIFRQSFPEKGQTYAFTQLLILAFNNGKDKVKDQEEFHNPFDTYIGGVYDPD